MTEPFPATKIADDVYWVGAVDWSLRNFHGYLTARGTTYNAYLVLDDKPTLIDTVKPGFFGEMLARVSSVIDPGEISYIVSNHSEMDHSGCLAEAIEAIRPEKLFASRMGVKALQDHFHADWDVTEVTSGDKLSLGSRTLAFLETRLLHWPDSMFSYLEEEELLFSQDAFGMHLASIERFADELPEHVLEWEAAKYYANIVLPFSPIVEKTLAKVGELGIAPKIIAPDHGPIYRENIAWIVDRYVRWAAQEWTKKAVVVYDTMWGSTAQMAQAISSGLAQSGVTARVLPLGASHRSDVATEVLDAGALVVGSPTINSGMFPTVADVLTYLRGLKPQHLIGAVFGSHGWSGEATKQIAECLEQMKVELVGEPLRAKYVPGKDVLSECYALGELVAKELVERCAP